jgi:DNA-binding PadR family transcriptional regulator
VADDLSRVTPATLDVLAVLLDTGAQHYGLAIAKHAKLKTGSVFPILARLENLGWATSRWETAADRPNGPRRRIYQVTEEGAARARNLLHERRPSLVLRPAPGGFMNGWRP